MSNLDRRDFIRVGIAAAAGLSAGCDSAVDPSPRDASGKPAAADASAPFELDELTIDQLQEGLKSGKYNCRTLAQKYLDRIEALNKKGPKLYAVLETNPDAIAIADALDKEFKEKGPRGPLHGIPLLLKDNIDTADKMTTTAGSTALRGSIAPQDSFVAARLRAAGAILLGKANMSEWAGWKSFARGTPGWSGRGYDGGRGGFCRNPYALDRVPGGSSSGSGVASASNLCAVAIGTETDGSIVGPSSRNCLVGIKPTIGLLS